MKQIFLSALVTIILSSCAGGGITSIPSSRHATVLDFTPFTKQGFLFTPEPYHGNYESIGLITVSVLASGERKRLRPGIYDWDWDLTPLQTDSVLNYFYQEATLLGADAVVRLSLTSSIADVVGQSVPRVTATGFAIRRIRE